MSGLTYRDTKLAELEHDEVDENFRYLDQKSNEYVVGHIYRGPVLRMYNGQLYLLSSGVTFPFTATNFTTELAAGNWLLLGSSSSYKGELNLTTPVLINGVGTVGDYYKVTEAGNYDFGAGVIEFKVGDFVFYDGTVYGHYIDNNQLLSSSYVKKSFYSTSEYNGVGSNVIIPFNPNGYSEIRLINSGLVSISGFDLSLMTGPNAEFPYQGKEIMIWNRTGGNVTLKHEDFATADYPMFLRAETDLVLPDNHILTFKYDAGGLQEKDKSFFSVDEIIGLASVLASKANLVAGKIPASELPSYVDDVLEFANLAAFPATGETGKIYLALDTNFTYRWTGSVYTKISDTGKLDKVSTVDVEKVYVKNADGTQGMKPTSELGRKSVQIISDCSSWQLNTNLFFVTTESANGVGWNSGNTLKSTQPGATSNAVSLLTNSGVVPIAISAYNSNLKKLVLEARHSYYRPNDRFLIGYYQKKSASPVTHINPTIIYDDIVPYGETSDGTYVVLKINSNILIPENAMIVYAIASNDPTANAAGNKFYCLTTHIILEEI